MKIKKITSLVCMFFLAQLAFGQINLEHVYDANMSPVYDMAFETMKAEYYGFDDVESGTFTIYNLDHSVHKVVNIKAPKGTTLSSINSFYTKVINSDPLVELYYIVKYNDSNDSPVSDLYIINENGDLIKKIENANSLYPIATDDGWKLRVNRTVYNGATYVKSQAMIYSLPTKLNSIPSETVESASIPYPNPASQAINIPYQLTGQWGTISIYTANGQFVEQKNVDKNFSNLMLDVSGYAKGMYYYKIGKQRGEFMVN